MCLLANAIKIQGLQASKDKVEANDGKKNLVLSINILSQHDYRKLT